MRLSAVLIASCALFLIFGATACGHEVGDSCAISSECSPNGDRICDTSQPGGYCTVLGCTEGSCPEEAVCIRFFPVGNSTIACDSQAEDLTEDRCSPEEICTIGDYCAPRSAEVRYCMKKCGGNGDCRDGYECRDLDQMVDHGGEPVPAEGEPVDAVDPTNFCAVEPI